eukprot:3239028-Rhodomonas_salina.1
MHWQCEPGCFTGKFQVGTRPGTKTTPASGYASTVTQAAHPVTANLKRAVFGTRAQDHSCQWTWHSWIRALTVG